MRNYLSWLEKIDSRLLIFVVLICNNLAFPLSGGEEQYLQYAKQWFQPEWIPGSFTLTEFAGPRLIFQIICGFFLQFISIEWFAMIARIVAFAMFAFPLARLFRQLTLSNAYIFIILQIFLVTDQSLFAREWMFRTFEPKVLAYVCLFWGLTDFLDKKYIRWAMWLVAASYFHVLVGGWFFATGMIYLLLNNRDWRQIAKLYAVFVLPLLPFIIYLVNGVFLNQPQVGSALNLNWVYVYYRLSHHLGIFDSWKFFADKHLTGVLLSAIWLAVCVVLLRKSLPDYLRLLIHFIIIILAINLLFVGVAALDAFVFAKSGGFGLKFYPFRQSTLAMFFLFLLIAAFSEWLLIEKKWFESIKTVMLIAVFGLFVSQTISVVKHNIQYFKGDSAYSKMIDFVHEKTTFDEQFILIDMGNFQSPPEYMSFSRRTQRENFVVFKFVPAGTAKLAEWYERNQVLEIIAKDASQLVPLMRKYGIDYVIAPHTIEDADLANVFQNEKYWVYRER